MASPGNRHSANCIGTLYERTSSTREMPCEQRRGDRRRRASQSSNIHNRRRSGRRRLSVCLSDSTHQIMAAGGAATTGMSRDTNSQDGGFDRRRPRDFDDVTRAPYVTSTSDLGSWHCDAAIGHYWYSDRSCSSVRPFPFCLLNQPTKQPMNFIFACVWIMTQLVTPRPIGERSIVMSVSVCVSLCVCVCLSTIISSELHARSSPFLCVLSIVVARSSSGGVLIRYIFPVSCI